MNPKASSLQPIFSLNNRENSSASDIEHLYALGFIQKIDLLAAQRLSGQLNSEDHLLLLAYLFSASRQGHLCVQLKPTLFPELSRVWSSESETLSSEDEEVYTQKILSAFQKIPLKLFEQSQHLVLENNLLYLQKNWLYEREIWDLFSKRERESPELELRQIDLSPGLLPEQAQAITTSFQSSLSFITGGPGVGKTYTASELIYHFLLTFPESKVALVAPTGKAVANLHANFLKYIEKQARYFDVDVFTLHKLFSRKIYSFLPYDLILVDETSMISVEFMRKLLKTAKPHSRVVLLGDPNQLPPIEAGFIFQDLLTLSRCKTYLSQCIRSEHESLIQSARYVKEGQFEPFFKQLEEKNSFFSLGETTPALFYQKLADRFPSRLRSYSSLELLAAFQSYKLLSPLRKGAFGVDQINQELREIFSSEGIFPILITANDYRLELYNGDVGVLIGHEEAIFPSRSNAESDFNAQEGVRRIPVSLLPSYEFAYCISVHKSQGSEYKQISLLLPQSSEVFGREVLYTAITRAKKSFDVFGDLNTLKKIFKCTAMRFSGIRAKEKNDER